MSAQGHSSLIAHFGRAGIHLGSLLVMPDVLLVRMMEAALPLSTLNAAEMFWYPSSDLCFEHYCLTKTSKESLFHCLVLEKQQN